MANYEFIRKQHFLLGKSIRQISRETGYSRQVIRKALTSTEIPVYQLSKPKPKPVIDFVKPIILEWLRQDEQAPPKQRHTAKRIYQRLVDEHGFTGGESTVRRYVRELRVSPPKAFVPLDFPPGRKRQIAHTLSPRCGLIYAGIRIGTRGRSVVAKATKGVNCPTLLDFSDREAAGVARTRTSST